VTLESWVQKWYSDYLANWGYAPSYEEYVKQGGKASLQEYYSAQLSEIKYVASKPTSTTMTQPNISTSILVEPESGSTLSKNINVTKSLPASAITQAPTKKKEEDFIGLFAKTVDEAIADFKRLVKNMTGVDI
jgi:hypothetical protein